MRIQILTGEAFMGKNFLEQNVVDSIMGKKKGTIRESMPIFVAIDLCGAILNGKGKKSKNKRNFAKFCQPPYMPEKYKKFYEILNDLFRNGIMHTYFPKSHAFLSSDPNDKNNHLARYKNGVLIYVPTFADDVKNGVLLVSANLRNGTISSNNWRKLQLDADNDGKSAFSNFFNRYGNDPDIKFIDKELIRDIPTDINPT